MAEKDSNSWSWMGSAAKRATARIDSELKKSNTQSDDSPEEDLDESQEPEPFMHSAATGDVSADSLEEDKAKDSDEEDDEEQEQQWKSEGINITQGPVSWEGYRINTDDVERKGEPVTIGRKSRSTNVLEGEMPEQQNLDPDRKTLLQGDARNEKSEKDKSEEQKSQSEAQKQQSRQDERVNAANAPMPSVPGAQMGAGIAGALGNAVGNIGGALFSGLRGGYKTGLGVASKQLENLDSFRATKNRSGDPAELQKSREALRNSIDAAVDDARKEISSERMGEHVNAISGNLEQYNTKIQQRAKEIESKQGPDAAKEFMDEQKNGLQEDMDMLGEELKEYPEHSAKLQELFAAVLDMCKKFINAVLEKIGLRDAPVAEAETSEQDMGLSPR